MNSHRVWEKFNFRFVLQISLRNVILTAAMLLCLICRTGWKRRFTLKRREGEELAKNRK